MPFYISDLYNQDVMDNVYEDEIPEDFDDKRRDVTRGFLSGFIYHRIGYRLEERGKRRVSGHLRQMAKKSDAGMQGLIMEELFEDVYSDFDFKAWKPQKWKDPKAYSSKVVLYVNETRFKELKQEYIDRIEALPDVA